MTAPQDPARPTARPCPLCGRPRQEAYRPFCSKRCADIDLHRWLAGAYVVPGEEEDGFAGAADRNEGEESLSEPSTSGRKSFRT